MGLLRSAATKAATPPPYIHLGGGQGYIVPPSRSVIYASPWDSGVEGRASTDDPFTYVPFFAGVRLLAESIGRLPLVLYERTGEDARKRARDKQLYRLLHDEWNPEMSALTGWTTIAGHRITRGNAYAEKVNDALGRLSQLWPFRPDRMQVLRDTETGRKFYRYRIESRGDEIDLRSDQVFHVPGFGYDGFVGYSILHLFRKAIDLGLSTQEFATRFFRSGGVPASIVTHPAGWADEKVNEFSGKIRANYQGLTNAQRIAIIEEGVSWDVVGIHADEAQMLESQKMSRSLTATMLNIPPHMLQDVERTTSWGTGIEEQTLGFVTFSVGSHLDGIAAETNRQLVRPAYGDKMYAEHLLEALLKGRALDRAKFYQALWQLGVINADTIAAKENLPKPEDGSGGTYWRPSNFEMALVVDEPDEPPTPPAPSANDPAPAA